jgi:hypothetical protein
VAGLSSVLLVVAGCGGSSNPGVAHLASAKGPTSGPSESGGESSGGSTSEASKPQAMVAFAQCMRTHGVPSFPEPHEGHVMFQGNPGKGLGPGSPQFEAAQKVCRHLLPNGGVPSPQEVAKMQERALKFSACMRSHGVPNFPTPSFEGGAVRLSLKAGTGVDPRSPQFQAAQQACHTYLPGGGDKNAPAGPQGVGG